MSEENAAPRSRRWRRLLLGGLLGPPLALFLLGVVLAGVHRGAEPSTSAFDGPLPAPAPDQTPLRAGQDADGDGLDDALEAEVARRHAPLYRFTGRNPQGPACAQDVDEEFFPMSVATFLARLEAGTHALAGGRSVRTAEPGRFEDARVVGFPSFLRGEPLGDAPVYTHVYPGDAPGEVVCEYWLFYGYDRAEAAVLGITTPFGDHRCDWEHSAYRVRLDPPELLAGYYYGHALCLLVPAADLERVDETHPVVYVSQGKHASYPQACVVASTPIPGWLVQHDDVANGLGPSWRSWEGALVDLGEREQPRPPAAGWLEFMGRWGPDGTHLGSIGLGTSPTGPAAKVSWGNNRAGVPWRAHLESRGGVLLTR